MSKRYIYFFFQLMFLCACSMAVAANSAGKVIALNGDVAVSRQQTSTSLAMGADIFSSDTITTGNDGRTQILLNDDTTISIGPNSVISLTDFMYESKEEKPSFSATVTKGIARFVTGKIVKQNRDGFSVKTPQATVGIRGTTFSTSVTDTGVTTVVGLAVTQGFPITVTNLKTGVSTAIDVTGMAIDATISGNNLYQAPASLMNQARASARGETATASSSTSSGDSSPETSAGSFQAAAAGSGAGSATSTASSAPTSGQAATAGAGSPDIANLPDILKPGSGKTPGDILASLPGGLGTPPSGVLPTPPAPTPVAATYSGGLTFIGATAGNFSFDVNLTAGSGTISNTVLTINMFGSNIVTTQVGTGTVTGGAFNNIYGAVTSSNSPSFSTGTQAGTIIDGQLDNSNGVSGNWSLIANTGPPGPNQPLQGVKQP